MTHSLAHMCTPALTHLPWFASCVHHFLLKDSIYMFPILNMSSILLTGVLFSSTRLITVFYKRAVVAEPSN